MSTRTTTTSNTSSSGGTRRPNGGVGAGGGAAADGGESGGLRTAAASAEAAAAAGRAGAVDQQQQLQDPLPSQCRDAVERLVDLKINFLAIDFDHTILDLHTGGRWTGTADELAKRVRPLFRHLMVEADRAGLMMAVVTFSPQVGTIAEVLRMHFPTFAETIVVRGRDGSWSYDGMGSKCGKQGHMASAVEELSARHPKVDITKRTTLLIDDDANNCRIALLDGVRAIWLNPNRCHNLLRDIAKLS